MPDDKSPKAARKTCAVCKKSFFVNLKVCPNCGEKNQDPFIGRTISERFVVESIIGEGGMGVVYKAWQAEQKQGVAVKILRQEFSDDDLSVKRFKHEAMAASRLSHSHIVALYDYGTTVDDYLYMVMEIIDGKSLAQLEREKRSIGVARTIKIITQVCDALDHAHQNAVVHRDLKPGNIMLTEFEDEPDYVKLVDFGLAKLLDQQGDPELEPKGEVLGSPLYMSPEQCLGRNLDGRSDIYSLGIVLYEALTGKVPYIGRTAQETIEMQVKNEPESFAAKRADLYIPEQLEAVVRKSLAKDPNARQQTMRELALELEAAVPKRIEPAVSISRTVDTSIKKPVKTIVTRKRNNKMSLTIGLLIILVLAGFAYKFFLSNLPG